MMIHLNEIRKFKETSANRGKFGIVAHIEERLGVGTIFTIKILDKDTTQLYNLYDLEKYSEFVQ
jgi:hypothetical protein